jgi:hypothetical protein
LLCFNLEAFVLACTPGLLTLGFSLNKEETLVDFDLVAMLLILKVND